MALQNSGAISLSDVNVELDNAATAQISLGDTAVRDLADVASGSISLNDLYGKSALLLASTMTAANYSGFYIGYNYATAGSLGDDQITIDGYTYEVAVLFAALPSGTINFGIRGRTDINLYLDKNSISKLVLDGVELPVTGNTSFIGSPSECRWQWSTGAGFTLPTIVDGQTYNFEVHP